MTFKKHQIMFNVWFHSWLCIIFQLIHNIPTFSLDLCCVTLLRIFRQIAQIEHFSYAYFRVLFLACDGRRRGDPNGVTTPPSCTRLQVALFKQYIVFNNKLNHSSDCFFFNVRIKGCIWSAFQTKIGHISL